MRQSSAEIDHAILDVAAGIFATYGFQHASVQQIADAVGYSKPGLLHRFGSKEALHRAVLQEVAETVQEIVGHTLAVQSQPDQMAQVLEHHLHHPPCPASDGAVVRPRALRPTRTGQSDKKSSSRTAATPSSSCAGAIRSAASRASGCASAIA